MAQLLVGVSSPEKFKKYTELNYRLHKIVREIVNIII